MAGVWLVQEGAAVHEEQDGLWQGFVVDAEGLKCKSCTSGRDWQAINLQMRQRQRSEGGANKQEAMQSKQKSLIKVRCSTGMSLL